jgi:hypothetical protein
VSEKAAPGRHVLPLRALIGEVPDGGDGFLVVDVE